MMSGKTVLSNTYFIKSVLHIIFDPEIYYQIICLHRSAKEINSLIRLDFSNRVGKDTVLPSLTGIKNFEIASHEGPTQAKHKIENSSVQLWHCTFN